MRTFAAFLLISIYLLLGPAEVVAIQITAPAPGAVVNAGQVVTMKAVLSAGEAADEVGFISSDGKSVASRGADDVFTAQVVVPREAVGLELFVAYALLTDGGTAMGRIELQVNPGPLRSLLVSSIPPMRAVGQIATIEVRGVFEDGVVRDLGGNERGTTYATSDNAIAAIDPLGLLQARTTGRVEITVRNRDKNFILPVQVQIPELVTNHIPVVAPMVDQTVASQTLVTLSVNATDPDGDPLTYGWNQQTGRVVLLRNPESAQPFFVSPRISSTDVLEFSVIVRDDEGATTLPVTVRVTVQP